MACKYLYNGKWHTEEELREVYNAEQGEGVSATLSEEDFNKLNSFELYENVDKLCPTGICNFTSLKATEKLREAGLNPYPNETGSSLTVGVKSPIGNFHIAHYVAATAIGDGIYIYDMPQNEFISEEFYGKDSDITLKSTFKPRLIPFTKDEIKANYNLTEQDALKFIRSILNERGNNLAPTFKSYIENNISNPKEYIAELEEEIQNAGLNISAYEEYKLKSKEREQVREAIKESFLTKKLNKEESEKVERLLETKLKLRTREYVPRTKQEFILKDLIKNVLGNTLFEYNYTDGIDEVLNKFGEYLKTEPFLTQMWFNYESSQGNLDVINKQLESIFSNRRLMTGFLDRAKSYGFKEALSKYDKSQQYIIRSLLPGGLDSYKSEAQGIFLLNKKFQDINEYIPYASKVEKKDLLNNLFKSRAIEQSKLEKAKTILNLLKVAEFDTEYIHQVISNEARRQYSFFQKKGQTMFQLEGTEGSVSSPKVLAKVREFLERIGVPINSVPQYNLVGEKIDFQGQADLLRDMIDVAEGKEGVALTEEAMHFAVAIIKQTNPDLFKKMMNKVGSYNYYNKIFPEYAKKYTIDGRPDILKIKEEAIGRILAEYLIYDTEGSTEKPELLGQTHSWWEQIKNFFLALIGKAQFNPFHEALKETEGIKDTKALEAPYEALARRIADKGLTGIYGAAANEAIRTGNYRRLVIELQDQLEDPNSKELATNILKGDEELIQAILNAGNEFQQIVSPSTDPLFERIDKKIIDYQLVKKQDKEDPDDENNNSYYEITVNGKPKKVDRTTEWAKKKTIQATGGRDYLASATPEQKKSWAHKSMSGLNGHYAVEGLIKANLTKDRLLKPKDQWKAPPTSLVNKGIYEAITKFFLGYTEPVTGDVVPGFLDQFPPGSKFGVEEMLFNEKAGPDGRASTLDLIVQLPDASVEVFDWKFMGFSLDTNTDQPFQKRKQHAFQMGDYKNTLKQAYEVKKASAKTIPFHAEYVEKQINGEKVPVLHSVTIGKVNIKDENRTYLLPVVPQGQSTGNKEIDQLVSSLEAHYEKMYKRKEAPEKKADKIKQLKELSDAIRNLQIALNFEPLAVEALKFKDNTERILNKYKNIDLSKINEEDLPKQLDELLDIFNSTTTYSGIDEVFSSEYKEEGMSAKNKRVLAALRIASSTAKQVKDEVLVIMSKYVSHIAQKEGVDNVLSPTKEVRGTLNNMIERGSIPLPMANLLTKRALDARSENKQKIARTIQEFGEKYLALEKLASSKGKQPFQLIGDGHQLIKKVTAEFWKEYEKAQEEHDRDFFFDNTNKEELKQALEDEINRRMEEIKKTTYTTNPKENEAKQKQHTEDLIKALNILDPKFNGWNDRTFNAIVRKHLIPLKEETKDSSHWTPEYKALHVKGNEAALDMYRFISSLNKKAFSLGYLQHTDSMAFFPFVSGTILERLSQASSTSSTLAELFKDIYTLDSAQEQAYGQTNPETGAKNKSIPRLFTHSKKEEEALSKDLLKVIPLYIRALEEYETSQDLEMEALTYYHVEKAKKHLETDRGGVIFDADGPKEFTGNENNAGIIEDMTDWLVYGIQESSNTLFDTAASKVTKGTEEEKQQKTLSAKKALTEGNKLTQGLAVGLKALVAIPNYVGAMMQAIINTGTFYTWKEYTSNHAKMVGSMLVGAGADVDKGLIDLVVPLNDDVVKEGQRKIARKQSPLKWLSTWTFQEFLMSTNQWPDKAHQLTNAKSFNDNSMVVDGRIVNIRQHLKSLPEYQERYKKGNVKEAEKQLEAKVKELKASSSLPKIAKFNAEGFLEIPGVSEEELAKYRSKVTEYGRYITGQMSHENSAKYRQDILVKSFMMFKNWIPKQVSLRTLDIHKNPSLDQWEYGRTRLFIKTIMHLGLKNIANMRDIITATPKGLEIMDEMLAQKKEEYYKKTGLELNITPEEFYDMVRKELSAQAKELALLFSMIGLVVAAKVAAPPDDEDVRSKNRYKFWAKAINKISDELRFYYDPTSASSITQGSIFPALGLLTKSEKFLHTAQKDLFGYIQGDEEAMEKAHTLKYFFNMLPVASQFQNELLPIIDAEAAKEWGIVVSSQARAFR